MQECAVSETARELLALALPRMRDHALVLLDPSGVIVGWLAGAEVIFGYREQEMVGCHSAVLFTPEDVALGLDKYELDVARRDSYSEDDRWHVRADNTRIWVSGTVTAIRDDAGELRGFLKVMRDRTDLRMNSEHRTHQLEVVAAAMERTHRFLETLGHELRNPLAPIKTSAQILTRVSDDPRILQVAQTISRQAAALERIVEDLMDVTRLRHRKLQLRLRDFDVRTLLEDEVQAQQPQAAAKGLQLLRVLPDQPLHLTADPDRLRQAVANLLTNAVKYTPEGGSIWVKATQEADDVVLRVQDTGIGIAPEVLPRIFELFTQESRAAHHAPDGLGVGLAIVKQIAELHGGLVQARSGGTGKGSEFTLRIPLHDPTALSDPVQGIADSG
ncbi:MAG: putative histidine kinase, classic, partial [Ramlibacter sp.]|nr:putative histidine kinase, classic [Ramlibacter sp.]